MHYIIAQDRTENYFRFWHDGMAKWTTIVSIAARYSTEDAARHDAQLLGRVFIRKVEDVTPTPEDDYNRAMRIL